MSPRLAPIVLAPLLALIVLSGCGRGDVIDDQKTRIAVRFDVEEATGEKVKSVECPADVPVSIGTTFNCFVTTKSGEEALYSLEVTSDSGDLKAIGLEKP